MTVLQFGINLFPHQWEDVSRIEEMGYDSAWTSEHIFFYFPTFDALTSLAAMAARTRRLRLGTAGFLLPLPPPTQAGGGGRAAYLGGRAFGRGHPARRAPGRRLRPVSLLAGALPRQPGE